MGKIFSPHLTLAKNYWKEHLKAGDLAIDATCGKGYDTLFLAGICSVIRLDIQLEALQATEALLKRHEEKAVLHRLCHAHIDALPLPFAPRLIVYNLGYLPGGDKSITTQTASTLESVRKSLELLAPDGALSIVCYPGHAEGQKEQIALEQWAIALPSNQWSVCHHQWLNRPRAPSLMWICSTIQKYVH